MPEPYRLDPLQTIIRVSFNKGKKKKKKPGKEKDPPETPKPGGCANCQIAVCVSCITCLCPGVFCIPPGGCCMPANCSFAGFILSHESPPYGCISHTWINAMLLNCCGQGGPSTGNCLDHVPFSGGPNYYPPGILPPFYGN